MATKRCGYTPCSTSGALAWLGLVLFAITVFQLVRSEPRRKANLMASAMAAKERNAAARAGKGTVE